jgi:hypothetical protein
MKFSNYLNENISIDAVGDYISDNCQPFLKEFGNQYSKENFIYRGVLSVGSDFLIKNTRKDRKPRYVDERSHKFLEEIGKRIFGWNIRKEGVFTGSFKTAQRYGKMVIFIPVGNYEYVFNKDTTDIYFEYDSLDNAFKADDDWQEERKEPFWKKDPAGLKQGDKESQNDIDTHKNTIEKIYRKDYKKIGLDRILSNNGIWEAIFKCEQSIICSYTHKLELKNIIQGIIK